MTTGAPAESADDKGGNSPLPSRGWSDIGIFVTIVSVTLALSAWCNNMRNDIKAINIKLETIKRILPKKTKQFWDDIDKNYKSLPTDPEKAVLMLQSTQAKLSPESQGSGEANLAVPTH